MDPEFFARSFRIYWDLGYQIHIHVNGDAGLDMVLDQLEQNLKRNPRKDHRTVIVHFAVSRPEQVARIKRLEAIVSGNPYYPVALADNYRVNGLGPERADAMVRMGDVERADISYSYHSDMPMAPGQPLFLIWAGVNRITNDGNIRGPAQRVSPLGALRAVTLDAAYSLQLEKQVGSHCAGQARQLLHPGRQSAAGGSGADQGHPRVGNGSGRQGATGPSPPWHGGHLGAGPRTGSPDDGGRAPGRSQLVRT